MRSQTLEELGEAENASSSRDEQMILGQDYRGADPVIQAVIEASLHDIPHPTAEVGTTAVNAQTSDALIRTRDDQPQFMQCC